MSNKSETVLSFANALADAAGGAILPYFRSGVEVFNKAEEGFDPVTLADRDAEAIMRDMIKSRRPGDAIIGEEFGNSDGNSGWEWILDPIDGTRAFLAGTTTWGVLVGAYFNGEPKIGVIYQPYTEERFVAYGSGTKYSRGIHSRPIRTNSAALIENSVLATTDPFLFEGPEMEAFMKLRNLAPITRYGLDCTAYALLAMGGIGLVVESGLKPFDIAALIPVVECAGGIFTDWKGNRNPTSGQVLAAANPQIHAQALEILAPYAK